MQKENKQWDTEALDFKIYSNTQKSYVKTEKKNRAYQSLFY